MKEAIEKFIAAIGKALDRHEIVDFRKPKKGEYFIPADEYSRFYTGIGDVEVTICVNDNVEYEGDGSLFIVKEKWVPKVDQIVAAKKEGLIYYVPFWEPHKIGNGMNDDHGRAYDSYRKITEEERKVLFPEEDSGLYVLVADRYSKDRHIIFEQYADESSLSKTRERQKNIDHKYGKTRIARLTFIEDWV